MASKGANITTVTGDSSFMLALAGANVHMYTLHAQYIDPYIKDENLHGHGILFNSYGHVK